MNKLKSKVHLSNFLDSMGVKTVTAYTDMHGKSHWMNCFARSVANTMTSRDEHCSSDVCHRWVVLISKGGWSPLVKTILEFGGGIFGTSENTPFLVLNV